MGRMSAHGGARVFMAYERDVGTHARMGAHGDMAFMHQYIYKENADQNVACTCSDSSSSIVEYSLVLKS